MKVKLSNNLLVAVLQAKLAVCSGINMMNVTINPLEGISIDNKKVNLGRSITMAGWLTRFRLKKR